MNKSNFNILLISLYNNEAYGLRLLHSILYKEGYNVKMLFLKINDKAIKQGINTLTYIELELLKECIWNFNPNIIGVSLVSSNFNLYKRIYKEIRPMGTFTIIVGGWQASLNPEDTIKYCDILFRGEAESEIVKLIETIYENRSLLFVKNIWFNTGIGVFKRNINPLISDLDTIPISIIDNSQSAYIENDKLQFKEPYFENTRYGTMIARGCPYKCTYCSNEFMANIVYPNTWNHIRHRSISHVINELKSIKETLHNIKRINFYDEIFRLPQHMHKEFCVQYKKYIKLPFYCMFYPGTFTEEIIKDLKKTGLKGVWIGIQSGSERVRKEIFKRFYSNDQIKKDANILHRYKIDTRYDFIMDNPFETEKEFQESIQLMKELPKSFSINLFSLKFFPNTEITQMALNRGIITQESLDDNLKADYQEYLVNEQKKNEVKQLLNEPKITIM